MHKRILVCDDDDGILDVVQLVLEDQGYEVLTYSNSEDIVDKIDAAQPHLILLDLWMPIISGEEIAYALRKRPSTCAIPIVIFSASHDTERVWRETGADAYLLKPFDIDELEQVVADHVR